MICAQRTCMNEFKQVRSNKIYCCKDCKNKEIRLKLRDDKMDKSEMRVDSYYLVRGLAV